MKEVFKFIGICIVAIIVFLFILWAATGNEFFLFKVFAPATESVRRDTFEKSKAYNQGMIQELQNMQFDYIKEDDPDAKAALASVILHRVADYDEEQLPSDLKTFIDKLKSEYKY